MVTSELLQVVPTTLTLPLQRKKSLQGSQQRAQLSNRPARKLQQVYRASGPYQDAF